MADEIHEDGTEESGPIKELRDQNKKLQAELAEAAEAKRQLAFVKAGIDLESKVGQLFYKAYDGELDAEALRAEAAELGALSGNAPAPTSKSTDIPDGERKSTEERQGIATGATHDEAQGPDPKETALQAGKDALAAGARSEEAIGEAFRIIAEAGFIDKDPRVIVR